MFIITNNPMVKEEINRFDVKYVERDYMGVLYEARDYIHKGYKIITHPLYGSVKPNETLYRSIVLEEGQNPDLMSINLIEEAIITTGKFMKNKITPEWTESVKEDFRVLDLDIIKNAVERII